MSTHMQPQAGDGCCCNGATGSRCACFGYGNDCGIGWICYAPRDQLGLPAQLPHQVRIVELNEDYTVASVILTSSAAMGGWSPPIGTSGRFAVQICCRPPAAYADCEWSNLWQGLINVTDESCPIGVSLEAFRLDRGNCGDTIQDQILLVANAFLTLMPGDTPGTYKCGIASLTIDGENAMQAYTPTSTYPDGPAAVVDTASVIAPYFGATPSPLSACYDSPAQYCGITSTAFGPWVLPRVIEKTLPIPQDCIEVKVVSACGRQRSCLYKIPCWMSVNYLRFEVPDWKGTSATCDYVFPEPIGNWSGHLFSCQPWEWWYSNATYTQSWTPGWDGGSYFFQTRSKQGLVCTGPSEILGEVYLTETYNLTGTKRPNGGGATSTITTSFYRKWKVQCVLEIYPSNVGGVIAKIRALGTEVEFSYASDGEKINYVGCGGNFNDCTKHTYASTELCAPAFALDMAVASYEDLGNHPTCGLKRVIWNMYMATLCPGKQFPVGSSYLREMTTPPRAKVPFGGATYGETVAL